MKVYWYDDGTVALTDDLRARRIRVGQREPSLCSPSANQIHEGNAGAVKAREAKVTPTDRLAPSAPATAGAGPGHNGRPYGAGTFVPNPSRGGCVVYVVRRGGAVKIGITRDVVKRMRALQAANDEPLVLLLAFHGSRKVERELHRRFAAYRKRGEWFEAAPDVLAWVERQRARCVAHGYGPSNVPMRAAEVAP